jgi:seryl-tRNA synthetase
MIKLRKSLQKAARVLNLTKLQISSNTADDDTLQSVPYYKQVSALYISTHRVQQSDHANTFQRLFQPNIRLSEIFRNLVCLNANLESRNKLVDVNKLKEDYLQLTDLQQQVHELNALKTTMTIDINRLVSANKNKKAREEILKSDDVQKILNRIKSLKTQIDSINERLLPLEEMVNIAALKLPNKIHAAVPIDEDRTLLEIEQDEEYLKANGLSITRNNAILNRWDTLLKGDSRFSFIDSNQFNTDEVFMCYMGETYARLELAINNHFLKRLKRFEEANNLEYVKGVSMQKSSIVEGK